MRGLRGICLSALAIAGSAEAGPWTQLQGDIYARANVSAERLDGEDGWRGDLYGEYGLGGGWMVNGKAESVRYDGGTQDSDAYRISARRQLWSNDKGWAIGAEDAVLHGTKGFKGVIPFAATMCSMLLLLIFIPISCNSW